MRNGQTEEWKMERGREGKSIRWRGRGEGSVFLEGDDVVLSIPENFAAG
jgi:hypothetical protein